MEAQPSKKFTYTLWKPKCKKKLNKDLERLNYLHRLFSSFIMRKLESFFSEFSLSYVSSIFYCFLLAGIVFGWRTFPCQKLQFVSSLKIWVSTSINIYCAAQRLSGGPSHTHTHTRIHTHTHTDTLTHSRPTQTQSHTHSTDTHTQTHTHTYTIDTETHTQSHFQTHILTDIHTEIQRKTHTQIETSTESYLKLVKNEQN